MVNSTLILVWLIPLFPLIGFLLNGIFGKRLGDKAVGIIGSGAMLFSFVVSGYLLLNYLALNQVGAEFHSTLFSWISVADLQLSVSFQVDSLSLMMAVMVTGVAFLIHVYSIGYMHGDGGFARFFSYMNLFSFMMLVLVLSDNYILMFLGWEGVGLCSYLLIGFWYEDDENASAGNKAFIVNRIGDFGFLLGALLLFITFGSFQYSEIFSQLDRFSVGDGTITAITLLLFVGAMGKSAQLPLYVWLPDAMAGPTPVSALIHAATMVTAGVYMVARSSFLYVLAPTSMTVIAVVGVATALFAASIALTQNDIKKVLAYSTISQLGYMFLALGVGAFSAGMFHLLTHAFFKGLMFLAAGSVMHALANEQDMRFMGGLRKKIPKTFITFLIGALAISGIPGLSGFFSKDELLWQAYSSPAGGFWFWLVGAVTAGLTAFYIFRLIFLTFYGEARWKPETHAHESPNKMTLPLIILAFLSVVGGYIGVPALLGGDNRIHYYLEANLAKLPVDAAAHQSHSLEFILMGISVLIAIAAIYLAYVFYVKRRELPELAAAKFKRAYNLSFNKFYVDELYDYLFVKRLITISKWLWNKFDVRVLDGMANGAGKLITVTGWYVRTVQSGLVSGYALSLFIGSLLMIGYYFFR
ncbi:MAG: NADH-quinone oxidoreductase subunit L [Candidatus Marinimicrobia bacterium]|nr:NADH-quinone oxidoreductase subunit L [Candidatus Neomarinimicrobiota bacterium]